MAIGKTFASVANVIDGSMKRWPARRSPPRRRPSSRPIAQAVTYSASPKFQHGRGIFVFADRERRRTQFRARDRVGSQDRGQRDEPPSHSNRSRSGRRRPDARLSRCCRPGIQVGDDVGYPPKRAERRDPK